MCSYYGSYTCCAVLCDQDLVCRIDLFSGLPLSSAREVLELTRRQEFKAGTHIVRKGDRGEAFFVIASGVAEVQVVRGGKAGAAGGATEAAGGGGAENGGSGAPVDGDADNGADGDAEDGDNRAVDNGFSKFFRVGDYFGEQALMRRNVRPPAPRLHFTPPFALLFVPHTPACGFA